MLLKSSYNNMLHLYLYSIVLDASSTHSQHALVASHCSHSCPGDDWWKLRHQPTTPSPTISTLARVKCLAQWQ